MEEVRIDVRNQKPEMIAEAKRSSELCFKINHTMPTSPECKRLIDELFNNTLGEGTVIHPPVYTSGRQGENREKCSHYERFSVHVISRFND